MTSVQDALFYKLERVLRRRAEKQLALLDEFLEACSPDAGNGPKEFCIAGGAIAKKESRDIDIFPLAGKGSFLSTHLDAFCVSMSARTTTCRLSDGTIVQHCGWTYETLEELVRSFDYPHIQAGVRLRYDKDLAGSRCYEIVEVFFTPEYAVACATGLSEYCGSETPLSSMLRAAKYHAYGEMSRAETVRSMLAALVDLLYTPIECYADFEKQLEGINLSHPADGPVSVSQNTLNRLARALIALSKVRSSYA